MRSLSKLRVVRLILPVLLIAACGGDDDPVAPNAADMDTYLASLPTWSEYSPPRPDSDEPVGNSESVAEEVDGVSYNCNTTPYSITQTPEKIVTLNPDVEVLWPGALLQGKGHLDGIGSLAELPIRQRNPLTISIDLLTGDNTRTVADPNLASVGAAVGELIQAATDENHRAGSKIAFDQVTTHSVEEAAIRMGFSASYYGVTVKSKLKASVSAKTSTITASYIQQMFTVSVVLPQTPGEFFSSSFTDALRQEQIDLGRLGPDNLPVFVSSVVYGRMLMFSLTARASVQEIRAALSIASGEVGGELTADQLDLLRTAEIGLIAVGGDPMNAEAAIRSGDFTDYFSADAALTTGRPISYTIRNLADNSVARVSETTEYNLKECVPSEIEITGYEYVITLEQIKYAKCDTSFLSGCSCNVALILVDYDFWVEDPDGTAKVASWDGNLISSPWVKNGDSIDINRVGTLDDRTVKLHFDSRDRVKIHGRIKEGNNNLTWDYAKVWPSMIEEGNFTLRAWSPGNCFRLDLRFNVTKGQALSG